MIIPKKTTKMIVKDGNGNLVQLLPEIETASTIDASSDVPVSNAALASALEDIEDSLPATSALLDVMEEEPTALNTTELDDEVLIVWMEPPMPSWSITINTELAGTGEKKGQIPFSLRYSFDYDASNDFIFNNASIVVDWGDGNTITYTNETSELVEYLTYEYAVPGIYTITIYSNYFDKMYILQANSNWLYGYNDQLYSTILTSINSPLPKLAGTCGMSWINEYTTGPELNDFYGCFSGCSSLQSIPSGLFDNNTAVISFASCFNNCSSLQSIPSGLFDNNTAVTGFEYCFSGCSSLQSIPSGLFDNNTAVTSFQYCFYSCSSLQSIPLGLFDNNIAVTTFYSCFWGCTSLQSIPSGLFDNNTAVTGFECCFRSCSSLQSIPSGLFDKNTQVTSFSDCFRECTSLNDFTLHIGSSTVSYCSNFVTKKTGTTRTIYVPSGSTTRTKFNAQASNLGLTIIGE